MLLILPSALLLCLCSGSVTSEELLVLPCDQSLFESQLQICLSHFNSSIHLLDFTGQCVWPQVKGLYHSLKSCVDAWARASWCTGVGSTADRFFLHVHRSYFQECGRVRDPPLSALVLMVAPLVLTTLVLPMVCVHLTTAGHH